MHKSEKIARSSNGWMSIFADLSALLLTFFVLTFSMASFEPIGSGLGSIDVDPEPGLDPDFALDLSSLNVEEQEFTRQANAYLAALVSDEVESSIFHSGSGFVTSRNGVKLNFPVEFSNIQELRFNIDPALDLVKRIKDRIDVTAIISVVGVDPAAGAKWLIDLGNITNQTGLIDQIEIGLAKEGQDIRLQMEFLT